MLFRCNPVLSLCLLFFYVQYTCNLTFRNCSQNCSLFRMNPSDSSDSDVPLDEALRKEVQRQEDYYKWVEKNASEALGKNHRAEMEKNFGIARNKHRQRQEEYKAVSKVKRTVGKSSEFFPRIRKEVEETKRRKVHTKQEADSR